MKIFLIAFVTIIVIAVIGGVVLNDIQEPASKAFSSPASVRLGA